MAVWKLPFLKSRHDGLDIDIWHNELVVIVHESPVERRRHPLIAVPIGSQEPIKRIVGDDLTGEKGCAMMYAGRRGSRVGRVQSRECKKNVLRVVVARVPKRYLRDWKWLRNGAAR